jgi:hypothetical protein
MNFESIFTMDTSSIKFGLGVTHEVGYDIYLEKFNFQIEYKKKNKVVS